MAASKPQACKRKRTGRGKAQLCSDMTYTRRVHGVVRRGVRHGGRAAESFLCFQRWWSVSVHEALHRAFRGRQAPSSKKQLRRRLLAVLARSWSARQHQGGICLRARAEGGRPRRMDSRSAWASPDGLQADAQGKAWLERECGAVGKGAMRFRLACGEQGLRGLSSSTFEVESSVGLAKTLHDTESGMRNASLAQARGLGTGATGTMRNAVCRLPLARRCRT
jgi:hypothetical protein